MGCPKSILIDYFNIQESKEVDSFDRVSRKAAAQLSIFVLDNYTELNNYIVIDFRLCILSV